MRWTATRKPSRKTTWHDWFAWHPVTIDGERVWLESVERRLEYHYGGCGDCVVYAFYRLPEGA